MSERKTEALVRERLRALGYIEPENGITVEEQKSEIAKVKKHESAERNKPVEYAVDGVLHYARHLARHYTVVAVAVSGTTASAMSVSSFLIPAGEARSSRTPTCCGWQVKVAYNPRRPSASSSGCWNRRTHSINAHPHSPSGVPRCSG